MDHFLARRILRQFIGNFKISTHGEEFKRICRIALNQENGIFELKIKRKLITFEISEEMRRVGGAGENFQILSDILKENLLQFQDYPDAKFMQNYDASVGFKQEEIFIEGLETLIEIKKGDSDLIGKIEKHLNYNKKTLESKKRQFFKSLKTI